METYELELSEMKSISGGVNPAYEIGYVIGSSIRHALYLSGLLGLSKLII
ncbi:MAG TPA: hypothetical protein VK213_03935 [Bacteroidales bacterium]|nr:hypothetical protein [Bacteroidales bacterium]